MPLFNNNTIGTRDLTLLKSHVNDISSYQLTTEQLDTAGISGNLNDNLDSIVNNIIGTVPEPDTIGDQSLFISEYYEGSTFNKYIEIFNPTDSEISLDDYALPHVHSAPTTVGKYEKWLPFTSGATISSKGFYIIAATEAESSILSKANQTIGYSTFFNGNDGFKLVKKIGNTYNFHNGAIEDVDFEVVDTLGDWQGDPGEGWDVAGLSEATKDRTLIRKPSVTKGNSDWNSSRGTNRFNSEWIVKEVSSDNLNIHVLFDTTNTQDSQGIAVAPNPVSVANNVTFRDSNDTVLGSVGVNGDLTSDSYDGITKSNIASVEITGTDVTSIRNNAFDTCTNLTSITLPGSLVNIGHEAFRVCSNLTSITIPDSVTNIGVNVFQHCDSLATVSMSDSVRSTLDLTFGTEQSFFGATTEIINVNANVIFRDSNSDVLHRAEVDGDLTSDSYDGITKTDIVSVEITGSNVTSLGRNVFFQFSNLTSFTIPDSVTSIDFNAFYNSGLTSITIPDTVTSMDSQVFWSCYSLESVTIGNSVTSIGDFVFQNCYNLSSVTMGNSVTTIGTSAFQSCTKLTSITLSDAITSLGKRAFQGTGITSFTISNTVTNIGQQCFKFCENLTSITIGNSVETINMMVFEGCSQLTQITLPNSVTSINDSAFSDSSLSTIYMSSTLATALGVSFGTQSYKGSPNTTEIVQI